MEEGDSRQPDCHLKVAVGLFRFGCQFEHTNSASTTDGTMQMLVHPILRYVQEVRGAGERWLWKRVETGEPHRRVHIASLYLCREFGGWVA